MRNDDIKKLTFLLKKEKKRNKYIKKNANKIENEQEGSEEKNNIG